MDDVLIETAKVRAELGYPGMATPFSQLVGIQAVLNLVSGERYKIVPDEVIQYAAGFYGETVAPIEANILDRIMSSPRGSKVAAQPPQQKTEEELYQEYGTRDPDELILRALMPETDLKKMRENGPVARDYPTLSSPELAEVARLMKVAKAPLVQIESQSLSVTLRR
jgi:oxaloacetate decarboxylase alpha subunit